MFNPYFTQMLNPAYLDVIDCPYLNYAKTPSPVNETPTKQCATVPEQNVSDFIDALKYDWESLDDETKKEYYNKMSQLMKNNVVENFEDSTSINTAYPHEMSAFIIYILIILGLLMYFLFNKRLKNYALPLLVIYIIIILIGSSMYYFSHL